MAIEGHKDVAGGRAALPGLSFRVVRFEPIREGSPFEPVSSVSDLRSILAPFRSHERLAICVERDGGESGSMWVHLTGERAWVIFADNHRGRAVHNPAVVVRVRAPLEEDQRTRRGRQGRVRLVGPEPETPNGTYRG